MDRFRIVKGVFGGSDVYDENGNQVGYSLPSILGDGEDFYDMDGNPAGQSYESVFGGEVFSGNGAHGYMDKEFMMGQNLWSHGNPFKKERPSDDFQGLDDFNGLDDSESGFSDDY